MTDRRTDRQTDGRAIAYTRYSIYAVARKKTSQLINKQTDVDIAVSSDSAKYCTSPKSHRFVVPYGTALRLTACEHGNIDATRRDFNLNSSARKISSPPIANKQGESRLKRELSKPLLREGDLTIKVCKTVK